MIVACPDGGTSIEDLAESNPELILKVRKWSVASGTTASVDTPVDRRFGGALQLLSLESFL